MSIDGQSLETVRSHKVLGLTIQNNLNLDEHIFSTISKASKRLHILRVLRRGGVSAVDLTTIHVALIRSILECCCVVWHNAGIPCHLSHDLEGIQKQAMRIIYPGQTYKESLQLASCPRLDARREDLCVNTLMSTSEGGLLAKYVTQTRYAHVNSH